MIWAISWRNVWRNKLRSTVIIFAVTIGVFAGVFTWAFYDGMVVQRINSAIQTESSHIQIHNVGFMDDPEIKNYLINADSICTLLKKLPEVKEVTSRTVVQAMINSAETGCGIRLVGIDPEAEKKVTNIAEKVDTGNYFESNTRKPIVIGKKIADKLNIGLKSKVVLTMQDLNGTIIREQFRVTGIYHVTNSVFEEMNVYVRSVDLNYLLGMDINSSHEIAIQLTSNDFLDVAGSKIKSLMPDYDVKTWRDLMPEVSLVESSTDLWMYITMIIILLALCFGIINTMLMAVLERVKELGMLMAVGMNKLRIFKMIMMETVFLSLLGGMLGIVVGYLISWYFMYHGIDLSSFAKGYAKLGYDAMIYPVVRVDIAINVTIMVIITGILAALYPAYKALKLKPVEAIRTDV